MSPETSEGFYLHHLPRLALLQDHLPGASVLQLGPGVDYDAQILTRLGAERVVSVSPPPTAPVGPGNGGAKPHDQERRQDGSRLTPGKGISTFTADFHRLPFADHLFDLVLAFEALTTAPEFGRTLTEIKRVMSPEGFLAISAPNFLRDDVREIMGEGERRYPYRAPAELYEALSQHFAHVTPLYQAPFFGYSLIEHRDATEPPKPFNISYDLLEGRSEKPLFFVFLVSDLEIILEEDRLVQVPFTHLVDRIQEGLRSFHRSLERKNSALLELREEMSVLRRDSGQQRDVSQRLRIQMSRLANRLETITHEIEPFLQESSGTPQEVRDSARRIRERVSDLLAGLGPHLELPHGLKAESLELPPTHGHAAGPTAGGQKSGSMSSDEARLLTQGLQGDEIDDALKQLENRPAGAIKLSGDRGASRAGRAVLPEDPVFQEDLAPFRLPGPVPLNRELRQDFDEALERLNQREAELRQVLSWRSSLLDQALGLESRLREELGNGHTTWQLRKAALHGWERLILLLQSDSLEIPDLPAAPKPRVLDSEMPADQAELFKALQSLHEPEPAPVNEAEEDLPVDLETTDEHALQPVAAQRSEGASATGKGPDEKDSLQGKRAAEPSTAPRDTPSSSEQDASELPEDALNFPELESESPDRERLAQLEARESTLRERELDAAEREHDQQLRSQALTSREQALAAREHGLDARQEFITAREEELTARYESLEAHAADLEAARAELHEQQAELANRRIDLDALEASLATQQAALTVRETALEARESEVAEGVQAGAEATVKDEGAPVSEAWERLAGLDAREAALETRHRELEAVARDLEARAQAFEAGGAARAEARLSQEPADEQESLLVARELDLYALEQRLAQAEQRILQVVAERDSLQARLEQIGMAQDGTAQDDSSEALAAWRQEVETAQAAATAAQATVQALREELDDAREALETLQILNAELEARVEALYRQRETLEAAAQEAREQAVQQTQVAAGVDVLQTELEELRGHLARQKAELDILREQAATAEELEALQDRAASTELAELRQRAAAAAELEASIVELQQQMAFQSAAVAHAQEISQAAESGRRELEQQLAERESEVAELKDEVQRAWKRNLEGGAGRGADLAGLESEAEVEDISQVAEPIADWRNQLQAQNERLEKLQKEVEARNILLTRLQKELDLKSTHNRNLQEIIGKQREDLDKIKGKIREAIEYIGRLHQSNQDKDQELDSLRKQLHRGDTPPMQA